MLPKDGKLHFSNLKHIATSPAHYALSCQEERTDSPAFRLGRAIHALVLQGIQPSVYHGAVRRGKEWDAFKIDAELNGINSDDILNDTEYDTVMESSNAVEGCPFAVEILERANVVEQQIDFVRNGIECRGRVDAHGPGILVEIKTTKCAKPQKFLYDAHKFGYHAQMAWYDIALGTKYIPMATDWREHYIIAVETSAPYCVAVYRLDALRIDQGHTLCETWLSSLADCMESGIYPSYIPETPYIWDGEIIISDPDED